MKHSKSRDWLSYQNRRAISTALSVLIAFLIVQHFKLDNAEWVVLSAFLVCQGTRGTPLKQGMITLFVTIAALFISALINAYAEFIIRISIASVLIMVGGYLAFLYFPLTRSRFISLLYFPTLVLIATLEPQYSGIMQDSRVLAAILGVMIGMAVTIIFIPMGLENEFRRALIPVIDRLENYSKTLRIYIGTQEFNRSNAEKILLEQSYQKHYPEWVFEVGFNPGLRSGFRYVLVSLDQVIDAMFSLSYHFNTEINSEIINRLKDVLNLTLTNNTDLIGLLLAYFKDKKIPILNHDLTSDVSQLESEVKALLPRHLEFVDMSREYLALAAIVRDIKDIRQLLLQLISALPAT